MMNGKKTRTTRDSWALLTCILAITNLLCQFYFSISSSTTSYPYYSSGNDTDGTYSIDAINKYANNIDLMKVPPKGSPPNLIAAKAHGDEITLGDTKRNVVGYGGKGDKIHLGGFTEIDPFGISPHVWRDMLEYFGVKSLLDVGCGRGISTSWFFYQGVDVQCVEGSHDAIQRNLLPELIVERAKMEHGLEADSVQVKNEISKRLVQHDFSVGPYWPDETVDAVWSVELLEHIGRNFQKNYLTAFKKAAYIFVSYSTWGGWHHAEVHDETWWKSRFEMYGFVFSRELTDRVKEIATSERSENIDFPVPIKDVTSTYNAQHVWTRMMVFINPAVASRPEHSHLLAEGGCYESKELPHVHCGFSPNKNSNDVVTPIPEEYKFIPYNETKHLQWEKFLKSKCNVATTSEKK